MKAMVKYEKGPGNMEIRDMEIPVPGDDEILIQVKCSAVCGVDALLYDWTYKGRYPVETPIVPGHECSGVIVEQGKAVKGLSPGDRGHSGIDHRLRPLLLLPPRHVQPLPAVGAPGHNPGRHFCRIHQGPGFRCPQTPRRCDRCAGRPGRAVVADRAYLRPHQVLA